jgi:phosphatidylglycerol:prolipoprotein diacylglycerol transferase
MLQYPNIDTVAIDLKFIQIHWYGISYLVGFLTAFLFGRIKAKNSKYCSPQQFEDLLFYAAMGVIIGGRLGYCLFYNLAYAINNPLWIFKIWLGGMSFHGGLLGVLIACWLWCHNNNKSFFSVTDFIAPLVPIGLFCGRIGNFINAELLGRESNLPWAMIFPNDPHQLARHPSQLYQAIAEGLLLFVILWVYSLKFKPERATSGWFLILYGSGRVITELFRAPDEHIGFLYNNILTMGQLLSIPMIILGIILVASTKHRTPVN